MTKKPNTEEQKKAHKEAVLKRVEDAVHNLLYHDRVEDKEISSELLFSLIGSRDVSTADIINTFAKELRKEVE